MARPGIDGLPSHWLTSYFPVIRGNEIQGVGVVMTDVSNTGVRRSSIRSSMANIAEGLYALDVVGRVTYVNGAASRMLGWAPRSCSASPCMRPSTSKRRTARRCLLRMPADQGQLDRTDHKS